MFRKTKVLYLEDRLMILKKLSKNNNTLWINIMLSKA